MKQNFKLKLLILLGVMLLGGAVVFAWNTYPKGCRHLGNDASRNATALWHQLSKASANGKWDRVMPALEKLGGDALNDFIYLDDPALQPRPVFAGEVDTGSSGATDPAAAAVWHAPDALPARPDWTWTTVGGAVYTNVKVVGMEQNAVTIVYAGGGKRLSLTDLDPDLQRELGYTPVSAAGAPNSGAATVALTDGWITDDYQVGVTQARLRGKKVLLFFTGSTWCPACIQIEKSIVPTSDFQTYGKSNFVMVKLELTHDGTSSDPKIQHNQQMAQKYGIHGVPTLISTTLDGKEIARNEGCPPDVNSLIARLDPSTPKPASPKTSTAGLQTPVILDPGGVAPGGGLAPVGL